MAKKKIPTDEKDMDKRIAELKIELLKQPTKKQSIKREIARVLTAKNMKTKSEDKK